MAFSKHGVAWVLGITNDQNHWNCVLISVFTSKVRKCENKMNLQMSS